MSNEHRIKEIIANSIDNATAESINNNQRLSDLGADSLTAIEIIVALEFEYNIDVPDDFDPDSTVQDLINLIENNS